MKLDSVTCRYFSQPPHQLDEEDLEDSAPALATEQQQQEPVAAPKTMDLEGTRRPLKSFPLVYDPMSGRFGTLLQQQQDHRRQQQRDDQYEASHGDPVTAPSHRRPFHEWVIKEFAAQRSSMKSILSLPSFITRWTERSSSSAEGDHHRDASTSTEITEALSALDEEFNVYIYLNRRMPRFWGTMWVLLFCCMLLIAWPNQMEIRATTCSSLVLLLLYVSLNYRLEQQMLALRSQWWSRRHQRSANKESADSNNNNLPWFSANDVLLPSTKSKSTATERNTSLDSNRRARLCCSTTRRLMRRNARLHECLSILIVLAFVLLYVAGLYARKYCYRRTPPPPSSSSTPAPLDPFLLPLNDTTTTPLTASPYSIVTNTTNRDWLRFSNSFTSSDCVDSIVFDGIFVNFLVITVIGIPQRWLRMRWRTVAVTIVCVALHWTPGWLPSASNSVAIFISVIFPVLALLAVMLTYLLENLKHREFEREVVLCFQVDEVQQLKRHATQVAWSAFPFDLDPLLITSGQPQHPNADATTSHRRLPASSAPPSSRPPLHPGHLSGSSSSFLHIVEQSTNSALIAMLSVPCWQSQQWRMFGPSQIARSAHEFLSLLERIDQRIAEGLRNDAKHLPQGVATLHRSSSTYRAYRMQFGDEIALAYFPLESPSSCSASSSSHSFFPLCDAVRNIFDLIVIAIITSIDSGPRAAGPVRVGIAIGAATLCAIGSRGGDDHGSNPQETSAGSSTPATPPSRVHMQMLLSGEAVAHARNLLGDLSQASSPKHAEEDERNRISRQHLVVSDAIHCCPRTMQVAHTARVEGFRPHPNGGCILVENAVVVTPSVSKDLLVQVTSSCPSSSHSVRGNERVLAEKEEEEEEEEEDDVKEVETKPLDVDSIYSHVIDDYDDDDGTNRPGLSGTLAHSTDHPDGESVAITKRRPLSTHLEDVTLQSHQPASTCVAVVRQLLTTVVASLLPLRPFPDRVVERVYQEKTVFALATRKRVVVSFAFAFVVAATLFLCSVSSVAMMKPVTIPHNLTRIDPVNVSFSNSTVTSVDTQRAALRWTWWCRWEQLWNGLLWRAKQALILAVAAVVVSGIGLFLVWRYYPSKEQCHDVHRRRGLIIVSIRVASTVYAALVLSCVLLAPGFALLSSTDILWLSVLMTVWLTLPLQVQPATSAIFDALICTVFLIVESQVDASLPSQTGSQGKPIRVLQIVLIWAQNAAIRIAMDGMQRQHFLVAVQSQKMKEQLSAELTVLEDFLGMLTPDPATSRDLVQCLHMKVATRAIRDDQCVDGRQAMKEGLSPVGFSRHSPHPMAVPSPRSIAETAWTSTTTPSTKSSKARSELTHDNNNNNNNSAGDRAPLETQLNEGAMFLFEFSLECASSAQQHQKNKKAALSSWAAEIQREAEDSQRLLLTQILHDAICRISNSASCSSEDPAEVGSSGGGGGRRVFGSLSTIGGCEGILIGEDAPTLVHVARQFVANTLATFDKALREQTYRNSSASIVGAKRLSGRYVFHYGPFVGAIAGRINPSSSSSHTRERNNNDIDDGGEGEEETSTLVVTVETLSTDSTLRSKTQQLHHEQEILATLERARCQTSSSLAIGLEEQDDWSQRFCIQYGIYGACVSEARILLKLCERGSCLETQVFGRVLQEHAEDNATASAALACRNRDSSSTDSGRSFFPRHDPPDHCYLPFKARTAMPGGGSGVGTLVVIHARFAEDLLKE